MPDKLKVVKGGGDKTKPRPGVLSEVVNPETIAKMDANDQIRWYNNTQKKMKQLEKSIKDSDFRVGILEKLDAPRTVLDPLYKERSTFWRALLRFESAMEKSADTVQLIGKQEAKRRERPLIRGFEERAVKDIDRITKQYGWESKQVEDLMKIFEFDDPTNLEARSVRVGKAGAKKYGWPEGAVVKLTPDQAKKWRAKRKVVPSADQFENRRLEIAIDKGALAQREEMKRLMGILTQDVESEADKVSWVKQWFKDEGKPIPTYLLEEMFPETMLGSEDSPRRILMGKQIEEYKKVVDAWDNAEVDKLPPDLQERFLKPHARSKPQVVAGEGLGSGVPEGKLKEIPLVVPSQDIIERGGTRVPRGRPKLLKDMAKRVSSRFALPVILVAGVIGAAEERRRAAKERAQLEQELKKKLGEYSEPSLFDAYGTNDLNQQPVVEETIITESPLGFRPPYRP